MKLTETELKALRYAAEGGTSKEIAELMGTSAQYVDKLFVKIKLKLNAENRLRCVLVARKRGLI